MATDCMKLVNESYQAVTQVKVLSPEDLPCCESRQGSCTGRRYVAERKDEYNGTVRNLGEPGYSRKYYLKDKSALPKNSKKI